MAASSSAPDVFGDILTTLHRLEVSFMNQHDRLSTIECTLSDAGTSPISRMGSVSPPHRSLAVEKSSRHDRGYLRTAETDGPPYQGYTASAYMASIVNMRRRFEFDTRSDVAEPYPEPASQYRGVLDADQECTVASFYGEYNDYYTMSAYSARPLSRFELDPPPIPALTQEFLEPQDKYACEFHHRASDIALPTMRYEETPETPTSATDTGSRRSFSESQHSTSTTATSVSSNQSHGQAESISSAYKALKRSIRRSTSSRCGDKSIIVTEQNTTPLQKTSILTPSLLNRAQGRAKACVSAFRGFFSSVARRMIEYQMNKLDV
ncbi:hypothetical protein SUNI508_10516 [Seiridium unicorne]|uniref:Uncharacterized protein n=1 Tax=Seiridium unicorne TaxID=138068 RepID=A0ABR2ULI3_9PEZI